ncbi:hypothetical protein [uncultured Aliiroseovarius sp.]|uniref:hypothetical protein n=1 Tax=uncultured Aliiroseovarius sp. TaxID=1658783 RepID=UPI0025990CDF|nr:hypothetical protein [uncultured Aliiroseovarius sp.]
MAHARPDSPIQALERLLMRERDLILAGEVAKLGRLEAQKDRLLCTLKTTADDGPALDRLRQIADHNQNLLTATARGIRAVMQRLDALRSGQTELRTYTQAGQAHDLGERQPRLERKA